MDGIFEFEKWKKEMKKGLVEMCILALLNSKEMYGYEISKELGRLSNGVLSIEEGTLYPLLRRLEMKKLIKGEWKIIEGKARKYYRILSLGREVLKDMAKFWSSLIDSVNKIFERGGLL